ncbi:MAG: response regulator transcription factor [Gammaproteobacteria bacterium]|nr:response regulator transcription factor [Gammaproteobacteria bacterium]
MNLLLVEDDLDLGAALAKALTQAGLRATWLRRLKEARAYLDSGMPEMLLLDLGLPDGEGLNLLKSLRGTGSALPILILSARDQLDDRLAALKAGADDYLVKPFAVEELLARIQVVARRASGFASDRWEFGRLVIEPEARRVRLDGEDVPLSSTEFELLMELARRAGKVVPKEALVARLYGEAERGSDNALEVHVHNLRKKLGAERILTLRGVGYMMARQE